MGRALAFYRDLLGFEVDWDMDHRSGEALSRVVGMEGAHCHMVMLRGYGLRLELFQYYNPLGAPWPGRRQCDLGFTHFALAVPDVHKEYERLLAAGVAFNAPPQNVRQGVWCTYMRDPEGNTVEVVQYSQG
jgi:catechol 2,3-dioxygenase-like lactoylglutathione lyase family enzyme